MVVGFQRCFFASLLSLFAMVHGLGGVAYKHRSVTGAWYPQVSSRKAL